MIPVPAAASSLAGVTAPGYNCGLPFPVDREIELLIDDIAFGGKGVGRADGKAVFVPFTIAGERVTAQVVREKKSFAEADLVAGGGNFAAPGRAALPLLRPLRRLQLPAHGV